MSTGHCCSNTGWKDFTPYATESLWTADTDVNNCQHKNNFFFELSPKSIRDATQLALHWRGRRGCGQTDHVTESWGMARVACAVKLRTDTKMCEVTVRILARSFKRRQALPRWMRANPLRDSIDYVWCIYYLLGLKQMPRDRKTKRVHTVDSSSNITKQNNLGFWMVSQGC